jgi:hypothetical protein
MTFLTDLAEVLQNSNNALAGVFLRTHAKEIVALVDAAEVINNRREDIFQHDADFIVLSEALAKLEKS